ncbi:NUDIX domain-containing protein [Segetibacter koreensis]|uniref:NUDIX domain-containing protein n=1 Tax=Segetibacter koreensis TaxID=398037 RepID=UPI00036B5C1D|nr:NUDIX domain-containing protein [Segetibacter koreensis]
MAQNVKIISTEVLSNNFFPLQKVGYEIQKKDGNTEELSREVYLSKNGATVLLYNRDNESVILTRQFRLPTYLNKNETGFLIEACAGLLEEDEDPKDTIIREIEEETGYKVHDVKKIFEMYMTPGSVAEMLHFFVAEYTPEQKVSDGGGLDHENEDIEVIEMPFEQAYNMIQSGEIKDAKTALLLQYARIYLFKGEKVFDIL